MGSVTNILGSGKLPEASRKRGRKQPFRKLRTKYHVDPARLVITVSMCIAKRLPVTCEML